MRATHNGRSARFTVKICVAVLGLVMAGATAPVAQGTARAPARSSAAPSEAHSARATLDRYCVNCHSEKLKTAGLVLEQLDLAHPRGHLETWEKVVKKLRAGAMPPTGAPRPDADAYRAFVASLEHILDQAGQQAPDPGRPPVHRLNRLQYTNAIRDLFGLQIDGKAMLPADDSGFGFDNISDVLAVSPAWLERYLLAATKISRLVVGDPTLVANQTTYRLPPLTLGQDERMSEHLPFGSRGGAAIEHYFPLDGEYSIKITLQRSDPADGYQVRGLDVPTEIDLRFDRERLELFSLGGPGANRLSGSAGGYTDEEYAPDSNLVVRIPVKAGSHVIGISFDQNNWEMEGVGLARLPATSAALSRGRITSPAFGRIDMGVDSVEIRGPLNGTRPAESALRSRVFVCRPAARSSEDACASQILSNVARRAYRRPPTSSELAMLMGFFRQARDEGNFDAGIQNALARLLVDLNFLFVTEHDPDGVKPGAPYPITDFELASRLAFFLWSSIPDDTLLSLAEQGRLRQLVVLESQVRRMLKDARSAAFVESFFGQWLTVRNVAAARPDAKVFPDFDENLRDAFQRETQLFLESQIREDRPAVELLTADYTFANERLAMHYGIPGVVGSHFRRVTFPDDSRAGLLGHGSVLMVTAYGDRTSVVQRGKWVLDHVLGTPPPPPPPVVPALEETEIRGTLRQRMELHRKNPVCASCHRTIDPLGFALENFDAIGKFRTLDSHAPIDASGVMVDGTSFTGPATFRQALLARQDAFLGTLTENLVTYALGRGVVPADMPAVRRVLREAGATDYRWSRLILEIVKSVPFQMRRAAS